jgi:antirestriction protein ArdC
MPSQTELRQQITHQIIEALTSGKLPPWRKPWSAHRNAGFPTNVASGNRYSGVNPLLLQIAAERHGLRSKYWGTFKQWQSLGGSVKRRPSDVPPGEWGTSIVFFKPITKTNTDPDTGEEEESRFGILRNYTVFNVDQVEGEHLDHLRVTDTTDSFIDYEPAERAIKATHADIRYGGDQAFYRQLTPDGVGDYIVMPPKHWFSPQSEFYAVTLHELMHWTEARLGWTGTYAEGELRAEIGACYALTELGVPHSEDMSNHHAYIRNWLKRLESDPRFVFRAATSASRAADFVLSFSREPEPVAV